MPPQSSTGSWDGADVGVGRTKMTAPRIVGDELEFLRQVWRGLASQRIKYQDDQLVLDSASHWQTSEVASKPTKYDIHGLELKQ